MVQDYVIGQLKDISLSMFRKNFFDIFHGSISARVEYNRFIINKKDAIFDALSCNDLIELTSKKDYRWNDASIDAGIHLMLYKNISEAKYVCYAMPPFTTAFTLTNSVIIPQDYFGYKEFGNIEIYDPKQFDDWYERADVEICKYMKENQTNIMIIKGYGIYAYDRDLRQLAKNMAIIENSCRLLHRTNENLK